MVYSSYHEHILFCAICKIRYGGGRSNLAHGGAHDAIGRFVENKQLLRCPFRNNNNSDSCLLRIVGSKIGNVNGLFLGILQPNTPSARRYRLKCGAYCGLGAAKGHNVGEGSKTWAGGLH